MNLTKLRTFRSRSHYVTLVACVALGCIQIVQPPAPAPVPAPATTPPQVARPGDEDSIASVFGIVTTDAAGEPHFAKTDSVPNVEGQEYGWFIRVGESERLVKWTEYLTLPAAGEWPDAADGPNVSISPDRRTAIVQSEAVPESGLIYHIWTVAEGDPSGEYTIVVKTQTGREERFVFSVEDPAPAPLPEAIDSPSVTTLADAVQACKEIQASTEIPIACTVEYIEGAPAMVVGFENEDDATDYWELMSEHIADPFCKAANNANRAAFVFVVISQKAARPYQCELDKWGEWFDLESDATDL